MWGWSRRDMGAVGRALDLAGVRLNCMTLDPLIPLVDASARDAFVDSVRESSRVAADVGCPFVVVLAGDALDGIPRSAQHRSIVDCLRRGAPLAAEAGVTLLLENLNSRVDHVGHYLDTTGETLDIVDEVDHPAVRMLYDMYHSVVMGEHPRDVLAGRFDRVAHVQIADVPGRHEPGTGTVNWAAELGWLAGQGYRGRIGLECVPTRGSAESVAYIRSVMAAIEAAV
jgi:hydroxypyruvate isomerase